MEIVPNSLGTRMDLQSIGSMLDEAGRDYWELVSTTPVADGNGQTLSILAVFKRPIS